MIKIAILISMIHLLYYAYVGVIYQFVKIGTIKNTPNEEVFRLRRVYGVKIKTFQKEGNHWGFSLGKTIYLNERLFKARKGSKDPLKALRWTFFHEYYHQKHHGLKIIIIRVLLSITPMLLILPLQSNFAILITIVVYVNVAYFVGFLTNTVFEKQANDYADKMITT